MDLVTKEIYYSEYVSTGYGLHGQNVITSYYQLSNDTDVMVFSNVEKLPVKLSQKG